MRKLITFIRRAPKQLIASVVMLASAVIIPTVVFAWGPSRPTFTGENPASYVTFNSITNNPQVGDERNFVRIRESGTGNYTDNVTFTPGKVYDVMVYCHNNAATNLNASGKGIAKGTTLKMEIPGIVNAGVNAALTGTISATNANPTSVYDQAYGKNATDGQIALRYVSGSAKFTSNGKINGQTLPDTLFTTGANLGYDAQDGTVPGCAQYSGYVIFQIRVDQPNFTVKKQVSVDNGKTWVDDSVEAKAGSTILYRIVYQNTGTNQQDNVSLDDKLPKGVTYVPGSTLIANSTTGGQYKSTKDGVTTNGYNAGSYQPKGNVYLKFSAKLPSEDELSCGTNTLVNTARATTTSGYKEDTATVTINKECKSVAKYTCNSLGVTVVDRTHFKFSTDYSVENATFKKVTYVVKDAKGKVVDTKTSTGKTLDYTQKTAGKYTVTATITVTVDGSEKTATSDGCKASFEVPEEPKTITVCEIDTKKIVTIDESDFDSSKYSKNLSDCEETPVTPVTPENPTTPETNPETPTELPQTGMSENILALTGLGALVAGIAYYIASRRALGL